MRSTLALLIVTSAACYEPAFDPCAVACSSDDRCPGTLTCLGDGFCHAAGEAPDCSAIVDSPYLTLSAGSRHTCAISDEGVLTCWGLDTSNQLGNAGVDDRTGEPTAVDPSGWTRVDGGTSHTCAIREGELWCWGKNDSGQVGQSGGGTVVIPTRVDPAGMADFLEVSTGPTHTCAIRGTAERRLYCWGSDNNDHLGDGAGDSSGSTLREVVGDVIDWATVAAGPDHSCGLRVDGTVLCWGAGSHGELGTDDDQDHATPTPAVSSEEFRTIAAGRNFSCGITVDALLFCWGDNAGHQLGIPVVLAEPVPTQIGTERGWTSVDATFSGACGSLNGVPYCWGSGGNGEIGNGVFLDAGTPTMVAGLTGVLQVVAGDYHACARRAEGISCWGLDGDGQLGIGVHATKYEPTRIGADEDWRQVVAGDDHTCGIRDGVVLGELYCWGQNDRLQLGTTSVGGSPVPVRVGTLGGWRVVGVGTRSTCALRTGTSTDELWCWGDNGYGQVGNDEGPGAYPPVELTATPTTWDHLAVGPHAVCAISGTERWCWGESASAQLGNGTDTPDLDEPTLVAGQTQLWETLSMSLHFGCGIVGGSPSCWGRSADGQQGNGTSGAVPPQLTPVSLGGSGWTAISGGFDGNHVCGIINGGVACWGNNSSGKLGDGATLLQEVPTAIMSASIPNPQGFSDVSAGSGHTCAINTFQLYCWGDESAAQLGDESLFPYSDEPAEIGDLSWRQVSAGKEHTCAITTDNELYCWGSNVHGVIGDGTEAHASPVSIAD